MTIFHKNNHDLIAKIKDENKDENKSESEIAISQYYNRLHSFSINVSGKYSAGRG
jgi:hypothetical protein